MNPLKHKLESIPGVHVAERDGVLVVEPVTEHDLIQALIALRNAEEKVRVSLARLARIGSFNDASLTVEADAGVLLSDLEAPANRAGMTLGPLSPKAMGLSLGEFLEGPYAGLRAVPGGRLEPISMALRVVTPDALLTSSHRSPRSAAGPELDALYLGSERRFGIISHATVRLFPKTATSQRASFSFAAPRDLVRALIAMLQDGVVLAHAVVEPRSGRFVASLQIRGTPESIERDLGTLGHRATDAQGRGAAAGREGVDGEDERALDWRELVAELEGGRALELWRLSVDGVIAKGARGGRALLATREWPALSWLEPLYRAVDTMGVMRMVS